MRRSEGGPRCQTTLVVLVGHGLRVGIATNGPSDTGAAVRQHGDLHYARMSPPAR